MSSLMPHYKINEQTMALIPSDFTDYQTIAIETDKNLHIKKTPFEIIERGCLDNFSSFEGRRNSITHLTGFKRKTPIPISVYRNIYAFPTHALKDRKCCWIFYHHVEVIVEVTLEQSVILFKNGTQVVIDVPRFELIKQLERTSLILSISRGGLRS
ncbi:competence protein ComK [Ornithinibacillus sp. 179-J 7C1 HS]|uniref:competence protein ComK n=1 Tax=Ornithinibacillus sp. 179-J 7C1 HS TaxID=3142384 RepID=UPI0039A34DD1